MKFMYYDEIDFISSYDDYRLEDHYDKYRMEVISKILEKANKSGIEVKSKFKEKEIEFIGFEEPCFLLVKIRGEWFFYTPFANFRIENRFPGTPRSVFREITGVKRVPHGKDALKKIEAMLLQASI